MQAYLTPSHYIDFDHPLIQQQAAALAQGVATPLIVAQRCFEFVRDQIKHSWDYQQNPVTRRASEVLQHGTGYCYAKSHLLAALLRANQIPVGLCYQRLSLGDAGPPYCLHGLNAIYLPDYGWYRVDARGNKAGIHTEFCPPKESLAFTIRDDEERDLPGIWAEPMLLVTAALERYDDVLLLAEDLPDVCE